MSCLPCGSSPNPLYLTPRQRDVLAHLQNGLSNRAIAQALAIDVRTVESHVAHLLTKTGSRNRTQLAVWALTTGAGDTPRSGPLAEPGS
ncbi:MAG: helix-turn-helix transcriptional regulator [Synechococcus sp. SB0665_bin_28]|nr:helix-turn-helix transcriptional regulator [Cyanobacteria bacterium MAG IRC4_bin_6]MXY62103.1 helix-turn-helix transcriptional regulator [Synechococcus sp. SB0665_bin_28]MYF19511.1 helix-turn-helix transcriptional regulator [Synechococcus sp. SB0677_bin_5]